MKTILTILIVLTIAQAAPAAEAILKAPATFPACELTILEAAGTKGETIEWTCTDKDVRCWLSPDKLSAVVWVPSPRKCVFLLKSTDKAGSDSTFAICEITGDQPEPPKPLPEPVKPPPVKPVIPTPIKPGRFNVTQCVTEEALKITHAERNAQALKVSASLRSVQSQIKAGVIDTTKTTNILQAITKANNQLPSEIRKTWSTWGRCWGGQIKILHDSGKLKTSQDWCDVLEETCTGLESLK